MTDTQIELKEIKATLKSMQEDIKRLERVPQGSYEWITDWVNYSTQGCSQEELMVLPKGDVRLSKVNDKTWKAKTEDIDQALMTPSFHCTYEEHP